MTAARRGPRRIPTGLLVDARPRHDARGYKSPYVRVVSIVDGSAIMRARLEYSAWQFVAPTAEKETNVSLLEEGYAPRRFVVGDFTHIPGRAGRELLTLVYGLDDAYTPELVKRVLHNWVRMPLEQRWLLATWANDLGFGNVGDEGKGWRAAIYKLLSSDVSNHHSCPFYVSSDYFL